MFTYLFSPAINPQRLNKTVTASELITVLITDLSNIIKQESNVTHRCLLYLFLNKIKQLEMVMQNRKDRLENIFIKLDKLSHADVYHPIQPVIRQFLHVHMPKIRMTTYGSGKLKDYHEDYAKAIQQMRRI